MRVKFNSIPKIKSSMAFCASRLLWKKASHARRRRGRLWALQEIAKSDASVHKEKTVIFPKLKKKEKQKKVKLGGEKMGTMGDFNLLPEDCFAHVISFTSPRHACRLSLVSSSFRLAVDSDATWERFLPSDYASFLSRAVQPIQYASKKELYMRLCDHPVQIDGGKLSFGLKKSTGAKCFTIPASEMNTLGYQDCEFWKLIPVSSSRFPKAGKVMFCRGMLISGRIDTKVLSSHTIYAPYLIFRTTRAVNLAAMSLFVSSVTIIESKFLNTSVLLLPPPGFSECYQRMFLRPPCNPIEISQNKWPHNMVYSENYTSDVKWPKKRIDGWMEVEMGQFYNENWEDRGVDIRFARFRDFIPAGIIFLGIELRPKTAVGTSRPWMCS